jgi:hypothetical protein
MLVRGASLRCTSRLARKAISSTMVMVMAMTNQVPPRCNPSSVIALVSTSMKPAPRKKNGR